MIDLYQISICPPRRTSHKSWLMVEESTLGKSKEKSGSPYLDRKTKHPPTKMVAGVLVRD
jgi:hypothetical protein